MSLRLPSRPEAWARLQQAAPPPWVLAHVVCVERLAVAMARAAPAELAINEGLVSRGALLHDIGRSITQDLRHGYLGADLLREDSQPEALVRIVECHTGAGIAPDEARAAGLPERDYVPATWEERIVAHADNFYSGDRRLGLEHIEAKYRAKGLDSAWHRIEALHETLGAALQADLEALEPAELPSLP